MEVDEHPPSSSKRKLFVGEQAVNFPRDNAEVVFENYCRYLIY
jgi:hypothetical protein